METSIHVRYLYYSLYHAYTSIYVYGLNTHTCMLTFLPYPHHTCWYKYFMKGRGMGTLLIGVRYRCREMVLGGHLAWYHWEKGSINRGDEENTLIWQHPLSLHSNFKNSSPSLPFCCRPETTAAGASFLHFLHSLSLFLPLIPFTNHSLTSFIPERVSFTYFTSFKDQVEQGCPRLSS